MLKRGSSQMVNKPDSDFSQPPIYTAALAKNDEKAA